MNGGLSRVERAMRRAVIVLCLLGGLAGPAPAKKPYPSDASCLALGAPKAPFAFGPGESLDYDLDALGAMAMAGSGVSSPRGGGGGIAGLTGIAPGRLYILRKTPCKGQIAIEVDLAKAINDPRQRPIIQPGDTLVLQYKPCEEALNFGTAAFFTFGITQLFQQRR